MPESLSDVFVSVGVDPARSNALAATIEATAAGAPAPVRWREISQTVLDRDLPFDAHLAAFHHVYRDWPDADGPPPAWLPAAHAMERANLGALARDVAAADYGEVHRWSVENRDEFWRWMVERLRIPFDRAPDAIRDGHDLRTPQWLPGARLNIAASCFQHDPDATAIFFQTPRHDIERVTYGQLDALSNRVANGLVEAGFAPGDAIGIAMPMNVEAVAIYLGIVKAGCAAVAVADAFSPEEMERRLRLGAAVGVVTQQVVVKIGDHPYAKLRAANAPRMVVLPAEPGAAVEDLRPEDVAWGDFLSDNESFAPVPRDPDAVTNVLFSSGTTRDPKAIPWTHTTPIRCAADAWLHHDIHPGDVLAWPTNLAWMMGPWLVYGSLVNRASLAIYAGQPVKKAFGEFVRDAGVTMLGVVPALVRSWRATRCMEGLDWGRIRTFSSTGERSNAADMLYLMHLAGWKPIIEYCGGTEIGGGYITGTVVQPAAAATFSTPAMGLDFVILDEKHQPADSGEVFLLPPSIGLSNTLLNCDHDEVYYADTPPSPKGEPLRRHGDQMERLPGGFFRSHGRADDTMNLKGIKVSSAEIERAFDRVEGLRETAAIAVPGAHAGPNQLIIYVVCEPDSETNPRRLRPKLAAALREHHSSYFKIHDVVVVDALPRTASNKVMRRLLRAEYQAEREQPPEG